MRHDLPFPLVFALGCRSMRSNPVPVRNEWDPIQAEESLTAAFAGTAVSGQWVLRLRDTTTKELNDGIGRAAVRDAHGDGGVAGWEVLDNTALAGRCRCSAKIGYVARAVCVFIWQSIVLGLVRWLVALPHPMRTKHLGIRC